MAEPCPSRRESQYPRPPQSLQHHLERHPSAARDVIALADAAGVEHDDPKTLRAGGMAPPPSPVRP
ncbi:hypothetical protein E4U40_004524 [Claviceps sp. LM458 group G5]|nr:hypothetical protein E4U40_004524 [Claviceps sp. LM458 group G5]KAG6043160.1 hypothetical protein E4U39_004880 [Claviceps sp. Clav50 group G5]